MEAYVSTLAAQTYLTPAEYVDVERKAVTKSEYLSGRIVAMSGASNAHNIITMNTANQLYNQLVDRDCLVYASDMRVRCTHPSPTSIRISLSFVGNHVLKMTFLIHFLT